MSMTRKNIGKAAKAVTVKLGEDWEMTYFEGEVTRDDVEVIRKDTVETRYEGFRGGPAKNKMCTEVVINMDREIVDALGWKNDRGGYDRNEAGQRTIMAFDSCDSDSERVIKAMRTRHAKSCERELSEALIDSEIDYLVRRANIDIQRSRENFLHRVSQVLAKYDEWTFDRQDEIDSISEKIDDLALQIVELRNKRHAIVAEEMREWLSEKMDDEKLREDLMDRAGFNREEEPLPKRRKKVRKTT